MTLSLYVVFFMGQTFLLLTPGTPTLFKYTALALVTRHLSVVHSPSTMDVLVAVKEMATAGGVGVCAEVGRGVGVR